MKLLFQSRRVALTVTMIGAAADIGLAGFVVIHRDAVARIAWERFGITGPVLFLIHEDAELALAIARHNFGGDAYDIPLAERAYQKALAIKPDIPLAHYQLARIYFIQGNYEKALAEITQELKLHPENLRSHYVRGLISPTVASRAIWNGRPRTSESLRSGHQKSGRSITIMRYHLL